MANYIRTYSGVRFVPTEPEKEKIQIEDIAHALPMLCRGNGHVKTFWSVGEHCICCAKEALARGLGARLALACLLHDASEAYLADVTRPVKAELPRYKEIEGPLQDLIWNKWLSAPLTSAENTQVFEIDDHMLAHEFIHIMDTKIVEPTPELLSNGEFSFTGFDTCRQEFLQLFRQLLGA